MKSLLHQLFETFIFTVYRKKIGAGPFSGMAYIDKAHGSAFTPKLLGTYEKELHRHILQIVHEKYDRIVEVGAAEGYYAVGLSFLYKRSGQKDFRIIAYDINPEARKALKTLAELNGVEELIEVRTLCSHQELNSLENKKTLIFCDIEGNELELLDPAKAERLYSVDMLIELHDGKEIFIADELKNRFQRSHEVEIIHFNLRTKEDAPKWILFPKLRIAAVREGRSKGLKWMFLKARAGTA